MIRIVEGGIKKPNVPAPARLPMTRSRSYPREISSLAVIRPTVTVVAADEPLTDAKSAHPSTVKWLSRPGTRRNHGARPVKSDSEIRVRNSISAIKMNSGKASNSGDTTVFHVCCAKSLIEGMFGRNRYSMPKAVPISPMPIQRPLPKSSVNRPRRVDTVFPMIPPLFQTFAGGQTLAQE